MAFEIKQSLKLSQRLVMTPQLQQAIKLLQLSRQEMQEMINTELIENPMLEEVESSSTQTEADTTNLENREAEGMTAAEAMQPSGDDKIVEGKTEFDWEEYVESFTSASPVPNTREVPDELPNFENMVSNSTDLVTHLEWQVSMSNMTGDERELADHILGNLNEDGYFTGSLEDIVKEIGFDLEDAEEVLKMMQRMDPGGVCARDLKECLLAQLEVRSKEDHESIENLELLIEIISHHLVDLENRNYQAITKATSRSLDEVYAVTKQMLELNPKPGKEYASMSDTQYITPDIYVYKVGDDYSIVLNEEGMPRLRVSSYYKRVLHQARAEAKQKGVNSKEYVQEKLRNAVWLIKSIHNRQKTIFRVMESIVKYQREFFEQGVHALKPLVLREVANDIGVHESTISRVTTNKYAHTPVGTFELKYFFNSGIAGIAGAGDVSSESVKQKIKELISKEDPKRPFSDQRLVQLLKEQNINIARRTVAKYREGLSILSSSRRKKLF